MQHRVSEVFPLPAPASEPADAGPMSGEQGVLPAEGSRVERFPSGSLDVSILTWKAPETSSVKTFSLLVGLPCTPLHPLPE